MTLLATVVEYEKADDCRREDERSRVGRASTVRNHAGQPFQVVVENLSSNGLSFSTVRRMDPGAWVRVGLAGGGVAEARVVRRDDDVHGCIFAHPLTPAQLRESFTGGLVIPGEFAQGGAPVEDHVSIRPWPGAVRVAVIFTLGAASWAAIAALASQILR